MLPGVTVEEAVRLGAKSLKAYGRLFFPRTVRQVGPDYEEDMDEALEGGGRYVAFKVYRGGFKTTKFRLFASKRIAYGISRTVLIVSETLSHSVRSVRWLRRQTMYNKEWAGAFGLRVGEKWTDEIIEIYHGVEDIPITIIALGITGQTRGINLDDYRPDLILVDDPCDDENTKTDAQKKKTESLVFGALAKSLAPPTEAPLAMLAIAQTPLAPGDIIDIAMKDPAFVRREYGCFNEHGRSRWESRFPTAFLLKEKQENINRNQLSIWMREMEVKIISTELASFKKEWLNYWTDLPEYMRIVAAIDPASSDDPKADKMAACFAGQFGRKIFFLEFVAAPKNEPGNFVAAFFAACSRWHPTELIVEGIGFQRVLSWIFKQEMERRRTWYSIHTIEGDKRRKSDRIIQCYATSGLAPHGNLYIRNGMADFEVQFELFGPEVEMHDDELDAGARAIERLLGLGPHILEGEFETVNEDQLEEMYGERPVNATCP